MWEKIKEKFSKSPSSSSLRYIRWYSIFVALSATIYLAMLISDWYINKTPNFTAMKEFLTLVLSGSAVAAITFAATWLADNDSNGIPDVLETSSTSSDSSESESSSSEISTLKNS